MKLLIDTLREIALDNNDYADDRHAWKWRKGLAQAAVSNFDKQQATALTRIVSVTASNGLPLEVTVQELIENLRVVEHVLHDPQATSTERSLFVACLMAADALEQLVQGDG